VKLVERLLREYASIWRPIFGPVRDFPLTLGDFRTFDLERDGEPTDLVFPHYVGESLNLYHHRDHRWYFARDQMKDEVWMFKCFDSMPGVASGKFPELADPPFRCTNFREYLAAPHCSFDIQNLNYTERPRESIEIRMLVFYDSR